MLGSCFSIVACHYAFLKCLVSFSSLFYSTMLTVSTWPLTCCRNGGARHGLRNLKFPKKEICTTFFVL